MVKFGYGGTAEPDYPFNWYSRNRDFTNFSRQYFVFNGKVFGNKKAMLKYKNRFLSLQAIEFIKESFTQLYKFNFKNEIWRPPQKGVFFYVFTTRS